MYALPPEWVDEEHVVDFANPISKELGIENAEVAFAAVMAENAASFDCPSDSAWKEAVAAAKKVADKDDAPAAGGKGRGKAANGKASRGKGSRKKKGATDDDNDLSAEAELQASLSILQDRRQALSSDQDQGEDEDDDLPPYVSASLRGR